MKNFNFYITDEHYKKILDISEKYNFSRKINNVIIPDFSKSLKYIISNCNNLSIDELDLDIFTLIKYKRLEKDKNVHITLSKKELELIDQFGKKYGFLKSNNNTNYYKSINAILEFF